MFRPVAHLTAEALNQLYLENKRSSSCKPVSDHYTYGNATEDDEFNNWAFEGDAIQNEMAHRWRVAYFSHAAEAVTS